MADIVDASCSMCGHVPDIFNGDEARRDPWVKVGTTTIDGTPEHVASVFGCSVAELCATIDDSVWCVGGRSLRVAHWFGDPSAVMLHCDIVRRQSEIDAEARMRPCINCEEHLCDTQFCEACVEGFRAMAPPCPECGPHGNRGEVLLASSWAKCTTCAGGKPGDLWGEVKTSSFPGVKSYTLAIGDLVFDEEVEVKRGPQPALSSALTAKGASAEVVQAGVSQFIDALNKPPPSFMDARREALRDLRSILLDRADDMSIKDFRRMVSSGGKVP